MIRQPQRPASGGDQAPKPDPWAPFRTFRFWIGLAILFAVNILVSNLFFSANQPQTVTIPYNTFIQQVDAGNVTSITSTGDSITGSTKTPVKEPPNGPSSKNFQTQRPSFATDDLEGMLRAHDVTINAKPTNQPPPLWETLLLSFGPTLLIILGFLYLTRRAAAGGA